MRCEVAWVGKEAHEIIKEAAVAAALGMRDGSASGATLLQTLAENDRFPGDADQLGQLISDPTTLLGQIDRQIGATVAAIQSLAAEQPEASNYRGARIP